MRICTIPTVNYKNKILAEQEDGQAQSGQAMGSNCSLNRLNLDTLEQTEIVKLEDVPHILVLWRNERVSSVCCSER